MRKIKRYLLVWCGMVCMLAACTATSEKVEILVTTNNRSKEFAKEEIALGTKEENALRVVLNPTECHQTIDGFGAAVTGSTCYNLMKMTQENRTRFLKETFSDTEGLGFSYIRISIGCSDFSLSEYTCCDEPGIEHFALQSEETEYVIPVLKEILAINPGIKILGSPWTCPKWMKVNNLEERQPFDSWTDGQLNPDCYADYATYFVKWVQAFEVEGICIHAVTPQNEPLNRGNSASLFMSWQEEQAFVKEALGPAFRSAGLDVKIYAFDHNYNYDNMPDQEDYPLRMYDDEVTASFLAGAAYHNYGGRRDELNDVQVRRPDKELIFTETSIGMWNDGRNLEKRLMEDMREVALGTVNNGCKAVMVWNLMLDTERGPNRKGGCQVCYGAVDIDVADYATITRNSHYYIIGHMSAVVKPGAVHIGLSNAPEGLMHAAFENSDGTYAYVVLNETEASVALEVGEDGNTFVCEVPAKAVASCRWKK